MGHEINVQYFLSKYSQMIAKQSSHEKIIEENENVLLLLKALTSRGRGTIQYNWTYQQHMGVKKLFIDHPLMEQVGTHLTIEDQIALSKWVPI
jgi:hypothetical protein